MSAPEPAEAKNWSRNAGLAQLNTFFGQRDAKPIDAFLFEPARTFDRAMTVTVGFHRRKNLHLIADVISNDAVVVRQRVEIDLSPGWTSGNVWLFRQGE